MSLGFILLFIYLGHKWSPKLYLLLQLFKPRDLNDYIFICIYKMSVTSNTYCI